MMNKGILNGLLEPTRPELLTKDPEFVAKTVEGLQRVIEQLKAGELVAVNCSTLRKKETSKEYLTSNQMVSACPGMGIIELVYIMNDMNTKFVQKYLSENGSTLLNPSIVVLNDKPI